MDIIRQLIFLVLVVMTLVALTYAIPCGENHNNYSMTKEQCDQCDNRRWLSGDGNCQLCPFCFPGKGLSQACGNGHGHDEQIDCISCDPTKHLYSNKYDAEQCKEGPHCNDFNRAYKEKPTSTSSAICGHCLDGFFIPKDMHFSPNRLTECDPCTLAVSAEDMQTCSNNETSTTSREPDPNSDFQIVIAGSVICVLIACTIFTTWRWKPSLFQLCICRDLFHRNKSDCTSYVEEGLLENEHSKDIEDTGGRIPSEVQQRPSKIELDNGEQQVIHVANGDKGFGKEDVSENNLAAQTEGTKITSTATKITERGNDLAIEDQANQE
ncbi:unnamed protein product [Owenia fusiformis]|uniref:TNFR-Cys domain-containing protein n=1 Tax=Owenia fusiformis TaxID=6347 RepID=A0A8S4NB36_OWEFU|nr:unnamed protein product [Owenia fusiformis]